VRPYLVGSDQPMLNWLSEDLADGYHTTLRPAPGGRDVQDRDE
jgi:hypothetical protein